MNAPSFHNVSFGAGPHIRPLRVLAQRVHELLGFLPALWRVFRVFYGVAALAVAALAMAFFVKLEGNDRATAATPNEPAAAEAMDFRLPVPTSQVLYVVGSKQQAASLLAFGLPSSDPEQILPAAQVSVLVADSPTNERWARIALDRIMEAHLTNASSATVQIVDLR
ncbi:MAG TPA: hypothetical protein VJB57_14070 [Dehalococcoidia bacterium]|nr:hypothetical protein [Dehalococcoidia bacterium]